MSRGQFGWLVLCLVIIFGTLIWGAVFRLTTGSDEPLPLMGMACFFGIGGMVGLLVGLGDK